ncbi:Isochorismatase [Pseudonocardia sp. Ae168_Ps1]|nr:Isochorismatase [Pseudonocardia sp. Ae150A_Ps1]OLL82461.1 Isochorismatase [Pseudonocardia sp. Ae168_Ps1]OLL83425.1 Isochorismatase [Pseudonocardia sp. Ae263_Ps1]OLL90535.1 Isochorismatase [Pseudonocardia sp. Ae356_Ps1]
MVLPHTAHATYDVPPGPGPSEGVPAFLAARAAEWSLGDAIEIVADPTAVHFHPAPSVNSRTERVDTWFS